MSFDYAASALAPTGLGITFYDFHNTSVYVNFRLNTHGFKVLHDGTSAGSEADLLSNKNMTLTGDNFRHAKAVKALWLKLLQALITKGLAPVLG